MKKAGFTCQPLSVSYNHNERYGVPSRKHSILNLLGLSMIEITGADFRDSFSSPESYVEARRKADAALDNDAV